MKNDNLQSLHSSFPVLSFSFDQVMRFYLFLVSIVVVILSFCFFITGASATNGDVGTNADATSKIGIGAKASAMGGTFVGVANDVSSAYWNPAGLGQINRPQLSAMHAEWLAGVRYEWVGFAQSFGRWVTLAGDVAFLHTGDIIRTLESGDEDGVFEYTNMALRIAFGTISYKGMRLGGAVNAFQQMVTFNNTTMLKARDSETPWNISISLGSLYETPIKNLRIGGSIQNFSGNAKRFFSQTEIDPLPRIIRIGFAYEVQVKLTESDLVEAEASGKRVEKRHSRMIIAFDVNFPNDRPANLHAGVEYMFRNGFSLRGGYQTETDFDFLSNLSGGLGYETESYNVDYAFVPFGDVGNTHRMSFTLRF